MWASLVGRFIIELRPEEEAYREKAVRMVESDSNTSAVKALIRKAILPFERRRHWFFCYLMCERAVMVMIVTLPSGRQAQTIQLFLALCLELVGAMIISRTQPFLQSDEDLADIGSRATNLVCVIVGILLALHGIRDGVAQYVLYIFTVMYILHFVYALDLRRVWRTFVNVVHLVRFQRKYGSYDKQKIKDLTEGEIASMDAYSVCYGWDTRRHLMLLRWHKDLAPKLDTYIRAFILNGSYLGGRITPYIGLLVRLEILDLSNNSFHGPIPESLGYLVRLRKLLLQRNYLQGAIPESLTKLQALEVLDLSFNYLEGSVPRAIFLLPSLNRLDLSFNHLTGTVPPVGFGGRRRSLDVIATRTQLSAIECGPLASVTSPRWEKVKELERVAEKARGDYDTDMAAVKSQTTAAVVFLRMAAVHVAWLTAVPFICIVAPVTIITLVLAGGIHNIYLASRGRPYEETPILLRKLYVFLEPVCRLSLGLPISVSVASAPSILEQLLRTDSAPKLSKHPTSCLQHLLDIVTHKVHQSKPPPRVKRGATKAAVLRSVLSATRRSASSTPHRAKSKWTTPLSARARAAALHDTHTESPAALIKNVLAANATAAERDEGKGGGVTSPPTGAGHESSTSSRASVLSFALPFAHRRRSRGVCVVPAGVEETVAGEGDKEMPEVVVDEEFIRGLYVPRTAVTEVEVDTAVE